MIKLKNKVAVLENEEVKNNSLNARVVTLWGSINSGKSSLATIIGKRLAMQNKDKNVVVLYSEENLPILPCIFPKNKLENQESLGNLYTPIKITENYLLENLTAIKSIKNMAIIGFKASENYAMYPPLSEDLAISIISELKKIFDYVIIDGASFFNTNQLTFSSFTISDICLKVCTQDLKSVSYFSSQDNFLDKIGIEFKNCKTIINKVFDNLIIEELFNKSNKFDYTVPFSEELNDNFLKGDLLLEIKDKNFIDSINKIIKEIF